MDFDLAVIGSGPGGYVAAIRAAQLGLKTAVIERGKPGGVCLNIGCIPSKAIIHQARIFESIRDLTEMGVHVDASTLDYSQVYAKSRKAADSLSRGVTYLLKKNKIEYIQDEAKLSGKDRITLKSGRNITAKNIILATGSRPRQIPGFEFDGTTVLSSDDALMLQKLPKRLLILGGGAIGVEFAYVMSSFGVQVHVVEMLDQLLPLEDAEIAKLLLSMYKKRGITVDTGTKAVSMRRTGEGVTVTLETEGKTREVEADQILSVVGRQPNSEGLGLEELGIETRRGYVVTGDYYETRVPGIYAIGDLIADSPMLAHVASKAGEIAAERIAGKTPHAKRMDLHGFPGAVYSEPQVASIGLTEKAAVAAGVTFNKASFPYRGAGKSVAIGQSEGMVKVLFDPGTHEILGAHIIGADATELIHEILLAKSAELLPEDIAGMVHAHPTLSEAVMESMRAVEGWAIHV